MSKDDTLIVLLRLPTEAQYNTVLAILKEYVAWMDLMITTGDDFARFEIKTSFTRQGDIQTKLIKYNKSLSSDGVVRYATCFSTRPIAPCGNALLVSFASAADAERAQANCKYAFTQLQGNWMYYRCSREGCEQAEKAMTEACAADEHVYSGVRFYKSLQ